METSDMQPNKIETVTVTPVGQADVKRSNKRKLVWGLVCLIGPTTLIILSILCFALLNFVTNSSSNTSDIRRVECSNAINEGICPPEEFNNDSTTDRSNIGKVVGNVALFIFGTVAVITWLPGIIVGIILLSTRKPVH